MCEKERTFDDISGEDAKRVLRLILEILRDEDVDDDKECFWRIEKLVMTFEDELDMHCGIRHDFG